MPCDVSSVNIDPTGPSGPSLPGFGTPFSLNLDGISDYIDGFPEDLLELLDQLSMLIPPGVLQAPLNPNFGKDIFDTILGLLNQFMPFLMLYKFFLPLLNIIICIIEVICASLNPFKMIRAIRRLFRKCIPEFLNLFPIFALIIMIISLLLMLLALIIYIIEQIAKLIEQILKNLLALKKAIADGDANSIIRIINKIGALMCFFQNLFVLLAVFNAIIQIFRDILKLSINIPPCGDSDADDPDGCCTPDVCPDIVQNTYTRATGTLTYLRAVTVDSGLSLPSFFGTYSLPLRSEGWQIYDTSQTEEQAFINIVDAYDIPSSFGDKPSFFPTDGTYNKDSNLRDVPYAIDLKVFYDPANWGRIGPGRYIEFKNCVVTNPPTRTAKNINNTNTTVSNGVFNIVGGTGYDEDGSLLTGFENDGVTPNNNPATLENFFHMENRDTTSEVILDTDGYQYFEAEYTFKPNFEFLYKKQLVSAGCEQDLNLDKAVINNAYAGSVAVLTQDITNIMDNGGNGFDFPNPELIFDQMSDALNAFRDNMTEDGANDFQNATNAILNKAQDDIKGSVGAIATAGISPCDSTIVISEKIQFTTKPIIVTVSLNERNGQPLVRNFPPDVAKNISNKLIGYVDFGTITRFEYDGSSSFTAQLTSEEDGTGTLTVAFDSEFLCKNNIPEDLDIAPSIDIQEVPYEFVKVTHAGDVTVTSDGKPRRDASDTSREAE